MKRARSLLPYLLVLITPMLGASTCGSDNDGGGGGEAYEGSWVRVGLTVDGSSHEFCNAQLDLGGTTWHSFTTGGGATACDCDLAGTMSVDDTSMVWTTSTVSGQYCGVWAPGDMATNTWMVSGDTLTLTNTEYGATTVETYSRIAGGDGDGDTGGDGDGDVSESCDQRNSYGICTDFIGAGWTEDAKAMFCMGGTLQTTACSSASAVGTCLMNAGDGNESLMTFYSDGTPPFDAAQAEQTCGNLNGTWTP
jgi:hypothetical protein